MAEQAEYSFSMTPSGPFSLAEAAAFGFGQRAAADFDGVLRLAFCLDGYSAHAGVELRQDPDGTVRCRALATGGASPDAIRAQAARVLSLDHDGTQFTEAGRRDPVLGRLQAAAPGLRPVLFYSPYEAAAWSVLSARRPAGQMMAVRDRLNQAHGVTFDLAGTPLAAFPDPAALLGVTEFPGIPADRLDRLHGVARAALDGKLDVRRLLGLDPETAMTDLQEVPGIGPFYSSLIVIRGTGFADVLPASEPRALALVSCLYHLDGLPDSEELTRLAEPWRPLRTWATVLIRAAAGRVLGPGELADAAEAVRLTRSRRPARAARAQ